MFDIFHMLSFQIPAAEREFCRKGAENFFLIAYADIFPRFSQNKAH